MSFYHLSYTAKFLDDYQGGIFTNDSTVAVVERSVIAPCFRCIGVHHLTPEENAGKRNIYLDCINAKTGKRMNERIEWGWLGMRTWEQPQPVVLDKPPYEPSGNISVDWGQIIWVRVLDQASDQVSGLTTQLADDGYGNRLGHHSYYVVFAYVETGVTVPPVDPPVEDCAALREENKKLRFIITSARDVLDKV